MSPRAGAGILALLLAASLTAYRQTLCFVDRSQASALEIVVSASRADSERHAAALTRDTSTQPRCRQ